MHKIFMATALSLLTLLICKTTWADVAQTTEFSYVPIVNGQQNYQKYLDDQGIERLRLVYRSSKDGKSHWYEVVDRKNKVLKRFGSQYTVSRRGAGRYQSQALLLVSATRNKCKKNCSANYLIRSDHSRPQKVKNLVFDGVLSSLVLNNGVFLSMNSTGLMLQGGNSMPAPLPIADGIFGSNVNGDWMAIAVSDVGAIMVANKDGWKVLEVVLSAHGDRKGIVSIYPHGKDKALIAIYRYTNEYNKGLYVLNYDMNSEETHQQGWLFNSEDRNIGFSPSIYVNSPNNKIVVSTTNSSASDSYLYFSMSPSQMNGLQTSLPLHVQSSGFAQEKIGSFMIGSGVSQVNWVANSEVEKNDVTFSEVNYLIADSLFYYTNIEARLGNTSFAINYMRNQAQDLTDSEIDSAFSNSTVASLAKEASSYLFSTIDFHGLLGASSSLRLQLEQGKTKGVAEIKKINTTEYTSFTTQYKRIAVLAMKERGLYVGGDYIVYNMPSAVGFSNSSGRIVYADFDPDLEFSSIRFVTGYDELSYAKRYETNLSRFFWTWSGNIGIGWASLSNKIKNDATQSTGKSDVAELPFFITAGGEMELGYIWQKRSKALKGTGYSSTLGYKVMGSYLGSGQGDDSSNNNADSLTLEFTRYDIFHGPFFKVNIIF